MAEGRLTSPETEKVAVGELLDDLLAEYQANGRNVRRLRVSLFATVRATRLSTAAVHRYTVERLEAKAAPASVNRELAALKRACTLAVRATPPKLWTRPYIPMLSEDNTRTGFFEREQFEAARRRHLPEDLRPLATVAYITGWRVPSELLALTWAQVGLHGGHVEVAPGHHEAPQGKAAACSA